MPVPVVALIFLAGLAIGSFLNVVAYRLPRGESLASPPSHCPSCDTPIKWYDNVPVLGWLMLRGRCRSCGEPISWRYPVVELGTGLLFGLVAATQDDTIRVVLGLLLVTTLVPVTLIDLDTRRIPNAITLPSAIAALVAGLALDLDFVPEQLIAGRRRVRVLLPRRLALPARHGHGRREARGRPGPVPRPRGRARRSSSRSSRASSSASSSSRGVGQAAGRKTAVPFGPFLALGGIIAFFVGDDIVDAYVDRF